MTSSKLWLAQAAVSVAAVNRALNCLKPLKLKEARIGGLYEADANYKWVASYENEEIQALYKDFLGKPLGHKAHELLHTHYTDRSAVLGTRKDVTPETCPTSPKFKG